MAINQKGANGLIAEYKSAAVLNLLLANDGFELATNQSELEANLAAAIARVGNELTTSQIERALKQGEASAVYIFEQLTSDPRAIGLEDFHLNRSTDVIKVSTVGNETNSGDPTDLIIEIHRNSILTTLAISLKAYKGPESSLGSKSSRATLCRMFLNSESVSDEEFIAFFGDKGASFLKELKKFKQTADDFYNSYLSKPFLDAYEARKGTRKVNNPLRRKEVGDYFIALHGYKSEHRLAELYVDLFNYGKTVIDTGGEHAEVFISALRFILGNPEMLVIDVIANEQGEIIEIHNSLDHPVYQAFNKVLNPGVELLLKYKPGSSIINVTLKNKSVVFNNLSLAMWKDGTLQYKLNAKDIK